MAGFNVLHEVGASQWRFCGIEFDADDAEIGMQFDHGVSSDERRADYFLE
jgi:hypothetical protein